MAQYLKNELPMFYFQNIKKIIAVICICLVSSVCFAKPVPQLSAATLQPINSQPQTSVSFLINGVNIKQLLTDQVKQGYSTGIAIAVVTHQNYHYYSFGKLNHSAKAPDVSQDTLFNIGSLANLFHSALVAKFALAQKVKQVSALNQVNQQLSEQDQSSYENFLSANILMPLQLTNTTYDLSPEQVDEAAQGYDATDKSVETDTNDTLYSSASDLAKFLAANMGAWKTPLETALRISQQLSWQIDDTRHLFWQSSQGNGFSAFIGFDTQQQMGVIVLTNSSNSLYTNNLAMHILYPNTKLLPIHTTAKISSTILQNYEGYYSAEKNT